LRKLWLIIPGLLVAGLILAMTTFAAPQAHADNGPHIKGWGVTADGCAACHRVHRGVNEFLLLGDVESLCLSCHGNDAIGSVLNVMGGTDEGNGGALRGGGFGTARINTADPSLPPATVTIGVLAAVDAQPVQSKHSTDGSAQTIWGNGAINATPVPGLAGYDLTCASCHDPHGNGNYRILKAIPDGSGAPTPGYSVPDTYPKTTNDYSTSNYFDMTFTGNVATDNILKDTSAWCAQCHTRYLAARRAPLPADASRVNSGDAIFTFRHTSAGVSYSTAATPVASNVTRACITCHAAHGSNATAGTYSGSVPDPAGFVATPAASNNKLLKMNNRGMCQKCHNK
jgi:predicted CXXCH cytochrome family protein